MHPLNFLQDLAIVMIVAAVVTGLFHRLKQPVVLGYILAGVIIGPHTPPFQLIAEAETIQTLSELGVIFLMFSLGLEFSLRKLRAVGATALIAASLEILVMVLAGYQVGRLFGWGTMDSIFLGAILSISSTTIIIKALEELGKTKEKFAELIFGILIVEDILAIVMLALLSGFAITGALDAGDVAATIGKLGSVSRRVARGGADLRAAIAQLRREVQEQRNAAHHGGGTVFRRLAARRETRLQRGARGVPDWRDRRRVAPDSSHRDPDASGAGHVQRGLLRLHRPADRSRDAREIRLPIVVITVVVIVGKVVACTVGTFVAGNDRARRLHVGMGLAQIGEFSFIIAALGLSLEGDERLPLSHRRGGFRADHADHALFDPEFGCAGQLV